MECVPSTAISKIHPHYPIHHCLERLIATVAGYCPLHLWHLALRMSKPSGFKITLTIAHKSGAQEGRKQETHHDTKEALHYVLQSTDLGIQFDDSFFRLLKLSKSAWFSSCNVRRIFDNSTSAWLSLSLEQMLKICNVLLQITSPNLLQFRFF